MRSTFLLVGCLFASGCSVFGIRTAEELDYTVVETHDDIEIRLYTPYLSAEASMAGSDQEVQSSLFRVLAGYIFGKNASEKDIAMTAPVLMEANSKETDPGTDIAMTAPVTMEPSDGDMWTMAFSMPSKYTMENIPKPLDDRIRLVEMPERMVAVIRFSGSFNDRKKRTEQTDELMAWLNQNPKYRVNGRPFFAGYDPPFTLPFLRRNEVLVEVIRVSQ